MDPWKKFSQYPYFCMCLNFIKRNFHDQAFTVYTTLCNLEIVTRRAAETRLTALRVKYKQLAHCP